MLDYSASREPESQLSQHPELNRIARQDVCGVHSLEKSLEAFAARYHLAKYAERTLDIQYYIWEDDLSGGLLFQALLDAAGRGVRVRLLLDDNNTHGLDKILSVLDSHPLIDVRLFNPFSFRKLRMLGYLTDFARLNRRMHNKSFTADSAATIIGGRNIGDAYFGVGDAPLFTDLDVLVVGKVVNEVAEDFERYWNCDAVLPLHAVVAQGSPRPIETEDDAEKQAEIERYLQQVAQTSLAKALHQGNVPFIQAPVRLLSDDPRKGEGRAAARTLLPERLRTVLGSPQQQVDIISSYFVPGRAGVAMILQLVRKGVKVAILTNSLAANDVAVVHAGYARWRRKLLHHGVALYELKPVSSARPGLHDHGLTGNSGSSLHAKIFSVDNQKVFIGSFNFDPRSVMLNTEMGLVIDSEPLARQLHHQFVQRQRSAAWELRLSRWGKIHWIDDEHGEEKVLRKEPQTRLSQRLLVWLARLLPIEWLL